MSSPLLRALADDLGDALRSLIDSERERLESERKFLLSVLDGRSDNVSVEATSSKLTEKYLRTSLLNYIPVEEADDG